MYVCPCCEKSHEENKFYCNKCCKFYCSIECLMDFGYFHPPISRYKEKYSLTFSCCNRRLCKRCYEKSPGSDNNQLLYECYLCGRFFHGNCYKDSLEQDDGSCMCKLCIDLNDYDKINVCRKCHDENGVKQFSFKILSGMKHAVSFDLSICKKYNRLVELIDSRSYNYFDCLDCLLIKCDCEMCKNVKCYTKLMRLLFSGETVNDYSAYWDYGNILLPIKLLNELAKSPDNECNCEICKFWKEY